MEDQTKTKAQLIAELNELREQVVESRSNAEEQEQLLGQVMDSVQEGVIVYGRDLRYRFWNRFMEDVTGVPANNILGQRPQEVFPFLREVGVIDKLDQALAGMVPVPTEYAYSLPESGRSGWACDESSPLRNADGEIIGVIAIVRDITGPKRAEEALLRSVEQERFLADIVEKAHQPIAIGYPDGRLGFCNRAFCNLTGYTEEELRSIDWAAALTPPEWIPPERKALAELERTGGPVRYEKEYIRKDGVRVPIDMLVHAVKDEVGRIRHYYAFITDITERKRVEEALRKERDFAESLVETARVIVLVLDPQGRIVRFNRYMEEISGYQLSEVQGHDWFSTFLPREDHARIRELLRQSLDSMQARGNVNAILTKDDRLRDIEWYDHTLRNGQGESIGVLAIGQDITERKQAEEELLKQHYYLEKAQELGQIGTWELDLRQDKLYWTDENCRIFGVRPGSVLSYEVFLEKVHPDDRDYVGREWSAALDGKAYDIEHRIDIDGTIRWVREKADLEFDEAGNAVKAIGFTQDITERREAQEALRESQEELAEIFNMSLDLICICDIDEAKFLKVNPAFTRVLGYDEAELVNHPFSEFIHPDDTEPTRKVLDDELQRGNKLAGFENRYRCKDGTWRWLEWTSHPLPERGIAFGVAHDTTERRQREERLRQAEKMEAIGQLAGGVAHDFNNQLGGIMNYADLLLSETDDEELRPFIDGIIRLCTRSGDLTNQLLAFSRKGQYQVVPVNMHRIVGEVVSLLGHSIDRRIQIRQRLDANPPTTTGDPTQVQTALLNLGLNARDAMPEGGELAFATDTVTLDEEHCSNSSFELMPGEYVRIRVTDSGTGMDKGTRSKIFEPFFTTKEQGKGTGMGLAAVFGTVVNHRGAIEVESEIGKGTTMTVYLPLLREEPREGEAGMHVAAQATAGSASARILVVDDEETVREFTAKLLRRNGYETVTCEDGADAVEYYGKSWQHIDLVILDMNMPGMNGRDTFMAMRHISPDVKAIIATGYSLDSNVQGVLDEGALSHIQKPFRIHDLVVQVERALGG